MLLLNNMNHIYEYIKRLVSSTSQVYRSADCRGTMSINYNIDFAPTSKTPFPRIGPPDVLLFEKQHFLCDIDSFTNSQFLEHSSGFDHQSALGKRYD